MAGATDEETTLLRERVATLWFAKTEVGPSIDSTITPQMAPDSAGGEAFGALDLLPRITLDERRDASPAPPPEDRRRDYAIVSTLGEGGMGRVHLARQRSLARDVAVKTLKPGATSAVAQALLREARVTGALEHPGVIPVHALGVDEARRPVLIMKRVDGVDLAAQLGGNPRVGEDLDACIEILIHVCRTVEFAHSRGVIHRDIKPENIMTGGFGEVYLLDWGIATTTGETDGGPIVGTPVYMAPEMVLGRTIDARTDVYLIGGTLHTILTGRCRHEGMTIPEVMRSALLSTPFAYGTEVPEELAELCNRATAKDPEARPQSAAEVRAELAAFLRRRGVRALTEAALERLFGLEELLAGAEGTPSDLAAAYRLIAEARFGLTQSLREHAAGPLAQQGMRRCIAAAIDLELRQDHVDSAAALFGEMDPPDPELARRIDERRAAMTARARERQRLEMLDRDLDPTEQASRRTPVIVAIAVVTGIIGGVIAFGGTRLTAESLVSVAAVIVGVLVVAGVALSRSVLTNAFNRRAAALVLLGMVAALGNRTLALFAARPPSVTLELDLYLFFLVMAAASIAFLRRLWMCAALFLAGIAAMRILPAQAAPVFSAVTFANLLLGAAILARARRQG